MAQLERIDAQQLRCDRQRVLRRLGHLAAAAHILRILLERNVAQMQHTGDHRINFQFGRVAESEPRQRLVQLLEVVVVVENGIFERAVGRVTSGLAARRNLLVGG